MRCIEMTGLCCLSLGVWVININMRCIEIILRHYSTACLQGLTLTWDVLKYYEFPKIITTYDD